MLKYYYVKILRTPYCGDGGRPYCTVFGPVTGASRNLHADTEQKATKRGVGEATEGGGESTERGRREEAEGDTSTQRGGGEVTEGGGGAVERAYGLL